MHDFEYRHGELACENLPISRIAKEVGTPCYVYSYATLVRHYQVFDGAFQNVPHIVAYAVKANSNLAILRLMAREGSGADIVSGGELYRALKAGIPPSASHTADIIKLLTAIKDKKLIVREPHFSENLPNEIAAQTGAKVAKVGIMVNGLPEAKTWIGMIDANLGAILKALE